MGYSTLQMSLVCPSVTPVEDIYVLFMLAASQTCTEPLLVGLALPIHALFYVQLGKDEELFLGKSEKYIAPPAGGKVE